MPGKRKKPRRHPTKSKDLGSARGPVKKIDFKTGMLIALVAIVVASLGMTFDAENGAYFVLLVFGLFVFLPNALWALAKWTNPFVIPYVLTMVRTHHFVHTLKSMGKLGKVWEKVCILGLFIGFGVTGVDYWVAREKGGLKRVVILIISAIIFVAFFMQFLNIFFSIPFMAPLFLICLIGFVLLGLGGFTLALMMGYGALSLNALITGVKICPSVAPVLPGVPIPGLGVIVPFIAWISLGLILIIHEGSHGIMMAYYKTKIHSVGVLLAGIFPVGAFVEQDDKEFSKMDDRKRVLVLSAGASFNLLTIVFAFFIMIGLGVGASAILSGEFEQMYSGVEVGMIQEKVGFCGIEKDAPAFGVIMEGDVITHINGSQINSVVDINRQVVNEGITDISVIRNGEDLNFVLEPAYLEDFGMYRVGIGFVPLKTDYIPPAWVEPTMLVYGSLNSILYFLLVLSFAVGMVNFFPSDPLDGGRMAKSILTPYFGFMDLNKKDTELLVGRLFAWLFVIAITLNLLAYVTLVF